MNTTRLHHLLEKYLHNSCSLAELKELLELFKRADNEPEIKHYLSEYWKQFSDIHTAGTEADAGDEAAWFDEIYSQALAREGATPQKNRQDSHRPGRTGMRARRKSGQWIKVAAVLLVSLMLSLFYYTLSQDEISNEIAYEQKAPGPGEKIRFTLPDGTQVHLNSDSRLEYEVSFDGTEREVYLEGEAYFVVARDEERPFLVYTNDVTTQVLGTSFNVRSYPEDEQVSVAVASGKVSVTDSRDSASENGVILEANQWADYTFESRSFQSGSGSITSLTAWNEGVLLYHDKQLAEVATQLERWYGVEIAFSNDDIKECVIRGEHRDETLVNVLDAITYAFDMSYQLDGRSVVLAGSGCR